MQKGARKRYQYRRRAGKPLKRIDIGIRYRYKYW